MNQPDYENPADADGDNVYKVTVVTRDGRGGRAEFDVCIAVMNVQEAGKVMLVDEDGNEVEQPRVKGAITAILMDPDGGVTGLDWDWTRSPTSPNEPWPDLSIGTDAKYTPTNAADIGAFLRATATYMDAVSTDEADGLTAMATTIHSVLEVEDLKQAPAFMEDGDDVESVEVTVAENSPSGTYVGEAILAAVDPDKGTTLIYTLENVDKGDDAKFFKLRALPVLDEGRRACH